MAFVMTDEDTKAAQTDARAELARALTYLESAAELERFLIDLCTPAELRALSERWHVARLLDESQMSYRDINSQTGVSTTTVGRVARFLRDEPHQGYRLVLDRMKDETND
jgi:TrpR-related protein YerC/YecD